MMQALKFISLLSFYQGRMPVRLYSQSNEGGGRGMGNTMGRAQISVAVPRRQRDLRSWMTMVAAELAGKCKIP